MKMRKNYGVLLCCTVIAVLFWLNPIHADAAVSKADKKAYMAVFDADYYYDTYSDVAAAFGKNKTALFNHFVNYGIAEGRSASAEFNPLGYKNRYADLQAAFGSNMASYCSHYIDYGKAEGRDASPCESVAQPAAAEKGQVLGTYTTKYDAKIKRAVNVELAASRINGVVIKPGESFSFSGTILPRTSENGYVVAPVIVNKQYTKGMGGGVCQVSSTLYAAMVDAGLPATERHPHSLPVNYMPEGLDATISGDKLDLKFDNIYTVSLEIKATAQNGELTVSLILLSE